MGNNMLMMPFGIGSRRFCRVRILCSAGYSGSSLASEDSSAFISIGGTSASSTSPGSNTAFLPALPFTFGLTQTLMVTLAATAHADSIHNSSAIFDLFAGAILLNLVGYDGPTGSNYPAAYACSRSVTSVPEPAYVYPCLLVAAVILVDRHRRSVTAKTLCYRKLFLPER